MAHSPSSRLDPSDPDRFRSVSTAEPELGVSLTEWQSALSAHGAGPLAADLALDLVLNRIVELARESTHASAAAIALTRDGEIICRAATGESAPDLGTRLNSDSGLSAACVQSGNWQRCDDSESDPRVDAELCRRLGVRSMLVVPVLKEGTAVGVLEVFSPHAQVFGDHEMETLGMLARSVVENIELAAKLPLHSAGLQTGGKPIEGASMAEVEERLAAEPRSPGGQTADFWTGVLMLAVVALALTLGWMVGRAGWKRENAFAQIGGQSRQVTSLQNRVPEQAAKAPATAGTKAQSEGELEVYQNGKLVFPQSPPQAKPHAAVAASGTGVQPAADRGQVTESRPVRISSDVASGLVIQRVEPEYPPSARERRVQGAVDLDALISKHGVVEKFTAIRGDPDLAAAASAAVRQWRFKPYQLNGQPESFQTHITVVFRLP